MMKACVQQEKGHGPHFRPCGLEPDLAHFSLTVPYHLRCPHLLWAGGGGLEIVVPSPEGSLVEGPHKTLPPCRIF